MARKVYSRSSRNNTPEASIWLGWCVLTSPFPEASPRAICSSWMHLPCSVWIPSILALFPLIMAVPVPLLRVIPSSGEGVWSVTIQEAAWAGWTSWCCQREVVSQPAACSWSLLFLLPRVRSAGTRLVLLWAGSHRRSRSRADSEKQKSHYGLFLAMVFYL